MKKKRIILVDDEPLALEGLNHLLKSKSDLEIVAQCKNGHEALEEIEKHQPDLLFLDIQMPGLSGFDVLELLADKAPPTIFVTAYDEYALKAFDAKAVDYLLKPVHPDRLDQALKQAFHYSRDNLNQAIETVQKHRGPLERILIRSGTGVQVVPSKEITYLEAQDDFVSIHTQKTSHLKYERLSRLEVLLDSDSFIRVHRSYILNINFLEKIEPYSRDSKLAYLKNGDAVPVSKSGYTKLLRFI